MEKRRLIELIKYTAAEMAMFYHLTDEDAESILDDFNSISGLDNVISWVAVENGLPDELETVWISNGKGWTTLGCLVYVEGGWHWAETNGLIYQDKGKIVSECESDDLDVKFWHRLPDPPCLYRFG